jgi:hypothetical protein
MVSRLVGSKPMARTDSVMRIEIGTYDPSPDNSEGADQLKAQPGLWALLSAYHGRMAILQLDACDNVRVAVTEAVARYEKQAQSDREGHYLYAVKYTDRVESQRLRPFEEEIKRKFKLTDGLSKS